MSDGPAYGFYGDDFTGATDTLAHLARAGLRTMLFFQPPTDAQLDAAGPLDAIGVASAARAMAPPAMKPALMRAGARFAELGVRILHYKVCSTFDSSPALGSIGAAVSTLRGFFPNPLVPVIGGQPGLQRYCAFGNLFAAGSSTGGGEAPPVLRIDRHPTMSRHPATPMLEADLRLHLQDQGLPGMGLIDWRHYTSTSGRLDAQVNGHIESACPAVLFDVLDDAHLAPIGRLLAERSAGVPLLAVGPSSVAQAWTMATRSADSSVPIASPAAALQVQRSSGPVFVFAGSLSPTTSRQIDAAHSYSRVEIDPAQVDAGSLDRYLDDIVTLLRSGKNVLTFTSRAFDQTSNRRDDTTRACAALVRRVVMSMTLRRICIAGGDTSSFAVQALGGWGLSYIGAIAEGVAMCRLHADAEELDGIEIALKGGQMGGIDFFERLLDESARRTTDKPNL
ncbi:four-carbon acid sugar kinase family protein [Paraburkholderia gardini]|uniref:3-oxo-isoapionate kinase n=1 Tax=Paraburkholderia gardini TaxID=2823469 RepID=A0ABM8UAU1_9BURK|nr:four-carbon acid sugar kinase family protein [Paraburkholderia gardini]CAG4924480.1 3-oxo-isoapionate kinase [Paraburkholderia gardini]